MLQFILDWLYIPRARAKANGATHEGRLFGVPCWMVNPDNDENEIFATPKSRCMLPWLTLCDVAFDVAALFISADRELAVPLHVGSRIDD